ncbi:MAG: outer membrane protein assembly factor BamA [Deltaproteobacteria bacterium]|nr:outer membrane protein assembly factor BamA [Deltaproteobacteria bacterium]
MTRHFTACLFIAATLLVVTAIAKADDLQAVKVSGNKRVESDAIRVAIKSQPGEPLNPTLVAADIKAIFLLGYFDNVRAEVKGEPGSEVLVFVVTEKPSIALVDYRGYDELDLDKIKEVVDIQPLSVLDIGKIKQNAQKIRELYIEKGFYLAEVEYELQKLEKNRTKITFVIIERAKVEVERITFGGNEKVPDDELKGFMETREGDFFSWLTSAGTFKQEALKRDLMRINQYYYDHGYINVKVSEPLVEISRDRKSLYITISVEEGEQYRFGNMAFSGDLMCNDRDLLKQIEIAIDSSATGLLLSRELIRELQKRMSDTEIARLRLSVLMELEKEVELRIAQGVWEEDQPLRPKGELLRERVRTELLNQLKTEVLKKLLLVEPGEIFHRSKLGMSMFKIQDVYKDRGYAYVEVVPGTNIDAESRIADINFNVQKGSKVFIERIDIRGNAKTRDKVIRRQLRIFEGEYYSGTGLEISRRRVNMLGFFEKVDIAEQKGSRPDRIVITVTVKERPTGTFQIGAGFSSVENFIATAQVSQQNLFGRGQTLSLMAQLSSLRQLFSVNFIEPYFLDTSWYFAFRLFNMQVDYINFLRKATGGDVTLGYEFIDDWRLSVTYTLENVDVSGRGGIRHHNLFSDGWTSSLRLTVTWDTRDNRLFPTSGHLLQGSAEHASKYTVSENEFTRFSAVGRYYIPIFWGFVIKTNLTLGYLTPGAPIFEKYFVGGIYSVRGYEPRSIGPKEEVAGKFDDPASALQLINVGGNKQVIANLELEFPIFPQVNIRGVLFLDAGNSFGEGTYMFANTYTDHPITNERIKETWLGLYWSAGFGFRWFSPIGPLRFEWGIPLTRRYGDKDILFEFTIGNFF